MLIALIATLSSPRARDAHGSALKSVHEECTSGRPMVSVHADAVEIRRPAGTVLFASLLLLSIALSTHYITSAPALFAPLVKVLWNRPLLVACSLVRAGVLLENRHRQRRGVRQQLASSPAMICHWIWIWAFAPFFAAATIPSTTDVWIILLSYALGCIVF